MKLRLKPVAGLSAEEELKKFARLSVDRGQIAENFEILNEHDEREDGALQLDGLTAILDFILSNQEVIGIFASHLLLFVKDVFKGGEIKITIRDGEKEYSLEGRSSDLVEPLSEVLAKLESKNGDGASIVVGPRN